MDSFKVIITLRAPGGIYKFQNKYVMTPTLQEILMLSAAERQELAENAMEQLARLVDYDVGHFFENLNDNIG